MKRTPRVSLAAAVLAAVFAFVGLVGRPSAAAVETTWTVSAPAQAVWSEYVTISVTGTVPKGAPKPIGTLRFAVDGNDVIGQAALSNGVARLRTKAIPIGIHAIEVWDQDDGVVTDHTIAVVPAATTTSLVSKKADVATGGTAWFQATVAAVAPATTTPAGSVAFTLDGASEPAATVALSGGTASWRPRLDDGRHRVTAAFVPAGDTHTASTSGTIVQPVGPQPPAGVADQVSPRGTVGYWSDNADFGQTFTAGATGLLDRVDVELHSARGSAGLQVYAVGGNGAPTGGPIGSAPVEPSGATVQTFVLDAPVAVQQGERYAFLVTGRGPEVSGGANQYAGGIMYLRASGFWLSEGGVDIGFTTYVRPADPAPTSSIAASTAQAAWSQYIDLTATVPGATTGTVTFSTGGSELGTAELAGGKAKLRTKALPLGTNEVTATGPTGPIDGVAIVTVSQAATTTTLTSRTTPVATGGPAWLQAKVAPVAPATTTPTGSVAFFLDGATEPAATVALSAGVASWRPRLADGPYEVTATFVPGPTHTASTSSTVVQRVGPTPPSARGAHSFGASGNDLWTGPIGQTFEATSTGVLDRVAISVSSDQAQLTLAIHPVDGSGVVGPAIGGSGPVDAGYASGYFSVAMASPVVLRQGRTYLISIVATPTGGDLWVDRSTFDPYPDGSRWVRTAEGTWQEDPGRDLWFETWVS